MNNDKQKTKAAPILAQMAIYASILFVSNVISSLMPSSFPVPTPVIGLILLYMLLNFKIIKLAWVDSLGTFLISLIGFLFVPSGISLAANLNIMATEGIQLVIVIALSTIIMLVVTAYTARTIIAFKKHLQETRNKTRNTKVQVTVSHAKGGN
ncbi:CidA/LrgA family protein [Ligilactobacillus ubinensis]